MCEQVLTLFVIQCKQVHRVWAAGTTSGAQSHNRPSHPTALALELLATGGWEVCVPTGAGRLRQLVLWGVGSCSSFKEEGNAEQQRICQIEGPHLPLKRHPVPLHHGGYTAPHISRPHSVCANFVCFATFWVFFTIPPPPPMCKHVTTLGGGYVFFFFEICEKRPFQKCMGGGVGAHSFQI